MKFDAAISLGLNCQSKYHILRSLYAAKYGALEGFEMASVRRAGIEHGRCFFDWCVAPAEAIADALDNRFEEAFQDENMRIEELGNGKQTVIDGAYGCAFPHDFCANRGVTLTKDQVLARLPEVREKYRHIAVETITSMSSKKLKLYVLYGDCSTDSLQAICCAIDRYDDNYRILLAGTESQPVFAGLSTRHRQRLISRQISHQPYPGNSAGWEAAFHAIDLSGIV